MDKCRISRMTKHFHHSPGCQRRFAIAIIIFTFIAIDTIGYHSVLILIIEHGTNLILCQFRLKMYGCNGLFPGIPSPKADKISNGM